jgi:hypothetical protein
MVHLDNFPIPKGKNTPLHNQKKAISGAGRERPPQKNTFTPRIVARGR